VEVRRIFAGVVGAIIIQRMFEPVLSKRNSRLLAQVGAVEFGGAHYPYLILLHVLFFISLICESRMRGLETAPFFFRFGLLLLMACQAVRFWVIQTLGIHWTTRVLVVPGERRIASGPYRWVSHPNYLLVALELFTLPAMFGLYWTVGVFSVANAVVLLKFRIPAEEAALTWAENQEMNR
jgi:methyltransferase